MSKVFHIVQKAIVRASNMEHAKRIANGDKGFGELLDSKILIEEEDTPTEMLYKQFNSFEDEDDEVDLGYENIHFTGSHPDFLRAENKRLARLAERYKNVRDEAVKAVYAAAFDAFASFEIPKSKKIFTNNYRSSNVPETAVAVLADWQLGKVTPDYNSEILAKRMDIYTEKLLEITEIQRSHHPVKNLHVWVLLLIIQRITGVAYFTNLNILMI
jgi:hypothetical protein